MPDFHNSLPIAIKMIWISDNFLAEKVKKEKRSKQETSLWLK